MPTRRFSLEPGGPKRVELAWTGFWRNIRLLLDGYEIGTIPDQKALKEGRDFLLPDGSTVRVQLVQRVRAPELHVTRNGQPLPGSDTDPEQRVTVAAGVVFLVGGISLLLGLIAVALRVELLQQLGLGYSSMAFGVLFLVLGWFVLGHSLVALIAAIVLFALDGILSLILAAQQGGSPPVGGIVVRVFLLIPMIQGIGALREMKRGQR